MPRPRSTPAYRLHKPSGLAVVRLDGKDHYLVQYGSAESETEYRRLIAKWSAQKVAEPSRPFGSDVTINELAVAFLDHADRYYRRSDGEPTGEADGIRVSLRPLLKLYGHGLAAEFGPRALKTVRQSMIDAGLTRTGINQRVGKIVRMFKWAVAEEMVPASVHHGLMAVAGLKKGRSSAREPKTVRPVPDAHVDAVRPFVSRQVWAMVELQRLTGMRSGEVTIMRSADLDVTGPVWTYTPDRHKTEHRDRKRTIAVGPQAQAVLKSWLRPALGEYLFQPREADAEHKARRRAERRTKVQPSQFDRRKANPRERPGERYGSKSYGRAITAAIRRHNRLALEKDPEAVQVPHWHPHQLRHATATRVRKEHGLDAARAVLGHSSPSVTEIYAELDMTKATEVAAHSG